MRGRSVAGVLTGVLIAFLVAAGCGPQGGETRPTWNDAGTPAASRPAPTTVAPAGQGRVTLPPETTEPGAGRAPTAPAPSARPEVATVPDAPGTAPAGAPAGFAELQSRLGGRLGYAWVPVGGGKVTAGGRWTTGVAWSTIKVPVAVAAVRAGKPVDANLRLAITASDNAAAEAVWGSLGPPEQAAKATTAVLRSGGDSSTTVPSTRLRAGYTVFGQTRWSVADQAQFAARLPCLQGAAPVTGLMGQIVADQRWGLGATELPARFKGGWGPSGASGYEVRQFGVITLGDGSQVGVALAAAPADGTMATGTRNLTALARWLTAQEGLIGGRC